MKLTGTFGTVHALPVDIVETIINQFSPIDPLTSLGANRTILRAYHRETAYKVLAVTSRRLREIFFERSMKTQVSTEGERLVMLKTLRQPGTQFLGSRIECVFLLPEPLDFVTLGGTEI